MEKKKLGLSDKTKLELSKTVGSGTVKQSFSHGRVKSVAVEVKKVRTFRKNNIGEKVSIEVGKKLDENISTSTDENKLLKNNENLDKSNESNFSNQDKLKQLKESAQSERIARENEISSTETHLRGRSGRIRFNASTRARSRRAQQIPPPPKCSRSPRLAPREVIERDQPNKYRVGESYYLLVK